MGLHGTNRNLSKACIAGVPEGEKQENEAGTVFEESVTEYFHCLPTFTLCLFAIIYPLSCPRQSRTCFLSIELNYVCSRISYKWNIQHGLLFLASLDQLKFLRFICVFVYINACSFFIAEKNSVIWIHHNLFIHSLLYKHLDYFLFLASLNKAAQMNVYKSG